MTINEEEQSGCPFRKYLLGEFCCQISPWGMDEVTKFLMCEFDWESCPDYQKHLKKSDGASLEIK